MITIVLAVVAFFIGRYFGASGTREAQEVTDKVVKAYFEQADRNRK